MSVESVHGYREEHMKAKAALWVLLAVCASAGAVLAHPSLGGPTGLVALPTAEALSLGQVEGALDAASGDDANIFPARVTAGLGGGSEVWGLWANVSDGAEKITGYGGKIPITRLPLVGLSIAGGIGFYRESNGGVDVRNLYLVATQDLPKAKAHLGLMAIRVEQAGGSSDAIRPFAGFNMSVGKRMTLAVEARRRWDAFDKKNLLSAVVRWPFMKLLTAEVGVTNGGYLGMAGDETHVFAGVKYRLGKLPSLTSLSDAARRPLITGNHD